MFVRILMLLLFSTALYATEVRDFRFSKTGYEKFEKVEATFKLSQNYKNTYDPAEVKVDAIITLPNQVQMTMPCFYFVPVTFEGKQWKKAIEHPKRSSWMLRFASAKSGKHLVKIKVKDKQGESYSNVIAVNISGGNRKGFLQISSKDKRYLQHSTGQPYYPVGFNVCWNNHKLVDFYSDYLGKMQQNNCNWSRYWLTDFARQALEWSKGHWSGWYSGLGVYSQRSAALLDSVLEMCQQKNIYIQLVLQHHGQFSTIFDAQWLPYKGNAGNPYYSGAGGFLDYASEFFSNTKAKEQAKKQYRYIIARWAYSSNILAWELFNEVDLTNGYWEDITTWHTHMSDYIKSIDPLNHIVATSSSADYILEMLDRSSLDMLQFHTYARNLETTLPQKAQYLKNKLKKSLMCGEFGTKGLDYKKHPDNWGDHVRKSMWLGVFTKVPNLFWFWDDYVYKKDMFYLFKPLGKYLQGIDFASQKNLLEHPCQLSSDKVKGYGLKSNQGAYGYIFNTQYGEWAASAKSVEQIKLSLSGLVDGTYSVVFMDPVSGKENSLKKVKVVSGSIALQLPTFSKGLAYKITKD